MEKQVIVFPGRALNDLGYKKGTVKKGFDYILYHQPTWKNNYYEVYGKMVPASREKKLLVNGRSQIINLHRFLH